MTLPSFTLTGSVEYLQGSTLTPLADSKVELTCNFPWDYFLNTTDAAALLLVRPVGATFDAAGSLVSADGISPVTLLAEDESLGLGVPIQWQVKVAGVPAWWFNAPANGVTIDLKATSAATALFPTQATGSQGAQGAVGSQGAAGTNGSQGAQGAAGAQGAVGAQGTAGTNGTNGAQGAQGAVGSQGAAGTNGTNGTNGSQGAVGAQGAVGVQGAVGAQGSVGPQGAAGTNGTNGTNGSQGAQGAQGAAGTGSQGAAGSAGAQGAAGTPNLVAGTTTQAPLVFASGTNLTTPAAGAVEYDGNVWYHTPGDADRHLADIEQFCTLTSAYTLTSQTALQQLFNCSTNGAVGLAVKSYFFECVFSLSSMSATSGNAMFGFGGTASLTDVLWVSTGIKNTANAGPAGAAAYNFSLNSNSTPVMSTNVQTSGSAIIKGKLRVTTAGTIIPQVGISVAAAAIVGVNSYFRIWPAGSTTVATVGNWS